MNDAPLPLTRSRSLAGLMQVGASDEPTRWPAAELGAVLRHQLDAPLEYDLRTIAPGGERTVGQMSAAVSTGAPPRSFGDLLRHPLPPLDLLRLMKDFARNGRDAGSLPVEVATILYYGAITLALVRHGARITELDDRALRKGIEWSVAQPWTSVDDELGRVFTAGLAQL